MHSMSDVLLKLNFGIYENHYFYCIVFCIDNL